MHRVPATMHGILKPSRNGGTYSPPTSTSAPYERRVSFGSTQPQQYAYSQQSTPHQWGTFQASANTYAPQVTSSNMYSTPQQPQAPQYAVPSYSSTATQSTPSQGDYSSSSTLYTYPSVTPITPTVPSPVQTQQSQHAPPPATPPSESPRRERSATVYGLKYSTTFSTLDELITALKTEMEQDAAQMPPLTTTTELCLSAGAMLPLLRPTIGPYADGGEQDLPPDFKRHYLESSPNSSEDSTQTQLRSQLQQSTGPNQVTPGSQKAEDVIKACPRADVSAILSVADPKIRSIIQRAASRGLVQHVENLDGFKYSFNNAWSAKDEDGLRFSYICQDSMQNKDRHANGYNRTQKRLENSGMRGPRKPTFDCKGSVSVKFSAKLQACVLQYRHCAVHSTVADRKPPPRPPPQPHTGNVRAMKRKRSADDGPAGPDYHATLAPMAPPPAPRQDQQLSLFELLQRSAAEDAKKSGQVGDAQTPWWTNT